MAEVTVCDIGEMDRGSTIQTIHFSKYESNGNNFIIIDERTEDISNHANLAMRLCNVKQSVGADGVLFLSSSRVANVRMRLFEPDGSESDMCGNGIRCIALYLQRLEGLSTSTIETNTGVVSGSITEEGVETNAGNLQDPYDFVGARSEFSKYNDLILTIEHEGRTFYILNIGEPHAIIIEDTVEINLASFEPFLRNPGLFPRGININVITKQSNERIRNRTFERGIWNYTTSCGTGSICSAVIAREILGCDSSQIVVTNDIGSQTIQFTANGIISTAKPTHCFDGTIGVPHE